MCVAINVVSNINWNFNNLFTANFLLFVLQVGLGKSEALESYLRLRSHAGLSAEEAESCAPARHGRLQQQQQKSGANAAHQPQM